MKDNLVEAILVGKPESDARVGQGYFRANLLSQHSSCLITGVSKSKHLVASHIKPWRNSNHDERLNPENGFLLTPSIGHLLIKASWTLSATMNRFAETQVSPLL